MIVSPVSPNLNIPQLLPDSGDLGIAAKASSTRTFKAPPPGAKAPPADCHSPGPIPAFKAPPAKLLVQQPDMTIHGSAGAAMTSQAAATPVMPRPAVTGDVPATLPRAHGPADIGLTINPPPADPANLTMVPMAGGGLRPFVANPQPAMPTDTLRWPVYKMRPDRSGNPDPLRSGYTVMIGDLDESQQPDEWPNVLVGWWRYHMQQSLGPRPAGHAHHAHGQSMPPTTDDKTNIYIYIYIPT